MTTPRKRTPKKIQQDVEVSTDTLTTYTVQVETEPELLYPPVPAHKSVGFGEVAIRYPRVEVPRWKTYLPYAPVIFGGLVIAIGVWALTI